MCRHEEKPCPRCGIRFECKPGNITQCQCYPVRLSAELRAYIEQRYRDCLCVSCLEYLSVELHYFTERYFYR